MYFPYFSCLISEFCLDIIPTHGDVCDSTPKKVCGLIISFMFCTYFMQATPTGIHMHLNVSKLLTEQYADT